jgi:CRISPR-associated protein Cas2
VKRLWVVCYDITDDRRRARLERWLLGQGDRVLESVFECVWRAEQLDNVRAELRRRIDPKSDKLRLTPVCATCRQASVVNGQRRGAAHPCFHIV